VIFRVNAGRIPAAHWLNDPLEGGGRLLGEGVHFLDFICGLLNMTPLILSAQGSGDAQNFVINMRFPDDSLGVIIYTAEGDPAYPKEQVEIFTAGGVALLDDFKSLQLHNLPGKSQKGKQDKGHRALLEEFAQAVQGKASLRVRAEDGLRATRLALLAAESIRSGQTLLTGEG
jgi:predicted dehydrogenase